MKVLKKGRQQKGWAKEFICTGEGNKNGGCGAELLVEEDDVFISGMINGSYCENGDIVYSFKCPECKVVTDIGTRKKVPDHIIKKLSNN